MPLPVAVRVTKLALLQAKAAPVRKQGPAFRGIMKTTAEASQNAFGDASIGISDSDSDPA
jgi:hypothetical protein